MTCRSINLYLIYTTIRKQFALLALDQGPRSKFSSGVGAKEECVKEHLGGAGGACLWISIQFLSSDGEGE